MGDLKNELKKYNKELLKKKFIIAITKCDLLEENKLNNCYFPTL